MPFCTQCGAQVQPADVFCSKCGMRQAAPGPVPRPDPLAGITPRTASMLCYIPIVGWIASIVVLASPKFRNERDVRFHAFQGLYLFVVWLLVDWVVAPFCMRCRAGTVLSSPLLACCTWLCSEHGYG